MDLLSMVGVLGTFYIVGFGFGFQYHAFKRFVESAT